MGAVYNQTIEEVYSGLQSSEKGISSEEANRRLALYGKNTIALEKKTDVLGMLMGQFTELLVLVLIAAGILSAFFGDIIDTVAIFAIVILNGLLGFLQEYKAERAIQALKKLGALTATVLRDGKWEEVDAQLLVPGDVVTLEEGSKIPADVRFIQLVETQVDEAILTGESNPVSKRMDALNGNQPVADQKNMGFANTSIVRGRAIALVVGTGMKTEFGKIAQSLEEIKEEETPLKKNLEILAKQLTEGVVVVMAVLFVIGYFMQGRPFVEIFLLAISLGVAAIPEGLPAITTISLALGIQKMAKRNALVKHLPSVETLGSTSVICSDKTGTLTKNEMTAEYVYADEELLHITGVGYRAKGTLERNDKPITLDENSAAYMTIQGGVYCNNAQFDSKSETILGDPTEASLLVAGAKARISIAGKRLKEFPFTSERKMMSVVQELPNGHARVYCKGALEKVLEHSNAVLEHGRRIPLTQAKKEQYIAQAETLSSNAYRILAFAYKDFTSTPAGEVNENNLVLTGLMALRDPPREEAARAIALCYDAGIRVKMITGDHPTTAAAIAKKLGLEGKAITGMELNDLNETQLRQVALECTVFARVDPIHKYKIVEQLQKAGYVVAVTGDGVNDAPAIKKADIGIAMGIKGTDVAKEAAAMVLKDDNFSTIVSAVEEGRTIYQNLQGFVRYLLAANFAEVLIVSFGFFLQRGEILSPIQLLWINLATDALPALALGEDPPAKDVMKRKPRAARAGILDNMPSFIIISGIIGTIATFAAYFYGLARGPEYASTMAFATIVVYELMLVFNSRQEGKSWLEVSPFTNKWLVLAVLASFGLQLLAIYVPFLDPIFGTKEILLQDWGVIFGVGLSAMICPYLNRAWIALSRKKEMTPIDTALA